MNEYRHDDETPKEPAVASSRGLGGDVFGPPSSTKRYRCPTHGELLAREIWWDREGQPNCPECDNTVTLIS
jgi:hypothetical protein